MMCQNTLNVAYRGRWRVVSVATILNPVFLSYGCFCSVDKPLARDGTVGMEGCDHTLLFLYRYKYI